MPASAEVTQWLLAGDPAIRWQVRRDLFEDASGAARERRQVAKTGWGSELLRHQDPSGMWAGGLYNPKWSSTTYTLLTLGNCGLDPGNPRARAGCRLLLERGCQPDGGISFFPSYPGSETCVTAMVLGLAAYFCADDPRKESLAAHLLERQMPDGGWNCQLVRGATHGSVHTTILALEALLAYEQSGGRERAQAGLAQARAREFLLVHRLFRSHRTGVLIHPSFTRFPFPPRWHYDVLRALDYFRACAAPRDPRLDEAVALVLRRRKPDGCWWLPRPYPGRVFFEMEAASGPSRWNTLRALRVLRWWSPGVASGKIPA